MEAGKKAAWIGIPLLVVGAAAAWGWAEWTLTDRVAGFAGDVHGVRVGRGMDSIPNEDAVAAQVRQLAAQRDLEVLDLHVSIEELSDDNMERADYVTREVGHKVQKAFEGDPPEGGGPHAHPRPRMKIKGSLVEVHATVHGSKWLWSIDDDVEVSKVLGRRAEITR